MISDMFELFAGRWDFFAGLLWEHLLISLTAIAVAVVIGGAAGIAISEFTRAAKPTLAVINFLYTIPSISMLGFLIPVSGVGNATAVIALTIYALLPMVRNTLGTSVIVAATSMLKEFELIYLTTNGGPGNATLNLPLYIYKTAFTENNYSYSNAMSVLLILLGVLIVYAINRLFRMEESDY